MPTSLEILDSEMNQLMGEGVTLPPNCFVWMKAKFVDYESRTMLKIEIPVMEETLNPLRVMQGGFITAAFDNAMGPLSYLAARNTCTTLDLHTHYIRSIAAGDTLTIIAKVVSRGQVSMHLMAEAENNKGKLIATCTSNMIIVTRK